MTGLLIKVIMCPLALIIADWLLPSVDYGSIWQPIITGLVIAGVGHIMEVAMLHRGTAMISTVMDFVAATLIIYLSGLVFGNTAQVTFWGAIIAGLIIAVVEYFTHSYLIKAHKTEKSPQD